MEAYEYVNFERKKQVQCEITCLEIKVSSTDSMKLLIFKFSKNDKNEKKKMEEQEEMLMTDYATEMVKTKENEYNAFKVRSDESKYFHFNYFRFQINWRAEFAAAGLTAKTNKLERQNSYLKRPNAQLPTIPLSS